MNIGVIDTNQECELPPLKATQMAKGFAPVICWLKNVVHKCWQQRSVMYGQGNGIKQCHAEASRMWPGRVSGSSRTLPKLWARRCPRSKFKDVMRSWTMWFKSWWVKIRNKSHKLLRKQQAAQKTNVQIIPQDSRQSWSLTGSSWWSNTLSLTCVQQKGPYIAKYGKRNKTS